MLELLGKTTFTGILMTIGYILLALFVFAVLVFIHELGHYTFGKIFKFKINEFSIGFGKAIWKKQRKNGELYALRMIPLGGYCAFEGEDEESGAEGAFNNQAWWKRVIVLFGGVFFNFISACIVSVFLLMVMGSGITAAYSFDEDYSAHISTLSENEYFQQYDVFLEIDGVRPSFLNGGAFSLMSKQKVGESYDVKVKRDGEEQILSITNYKKVERNDREFNSSGLYQEAYVRYNFGDSLLKSVPFCLQMSWECLEIIGQLIVGDYEISNLGGPVTAVKAIAKASAVNIRYILLFFTVLSINLAVFNALPIPALDGARIVFVLIEAIRKKPIKRELEQKIHTIGLLILFGFIIIVDLLQLFIFRLV